MCVIPSLTYPYFILFYEVTTVTLSVKGHTVKPTILIYSRRKVILLKSPIQFFDNKSKLDQKQVEQFLVVVCLIF